MENRDLFGNLIHLDKRNMRDYFIVPPFSVINTVDEDWKNRKLRWLKITGNLTETKEGMIKKEVPSESHLELLMQKLNGGSSNFDPVLAEIMIKWFNTKNGKVLDPFGGEQTKGVVCGELGYSYSGCEFRKEQVDLNKKICEKYENVNYYCGDSNNIDSIIKERNFDLCFTSPPYYDLEIYSKEDMSALGTYEEFMKQYKNIFSKCYNMLNDNRFLVIKVCEIRDKKTGIYRNFVGDNIRIMEEIGFKYYNEIIVLNSVGTLPLRATKQMNSGRKIGKRHQNVLVFFKGDIKKISSYYHELMPDNQYYNK